MVFAQHYAVASFVPLLLLWPQNALYSCIFLHPLHTSSCFKRGSLVPTLIQPQKKVQQTGMMKFDACKRRLQHLASEQLCANSFSQNHQTRSGKRYFPLVFIAVFYRCSGVGGEVQCRTEICEWRKNGTVGQDKQEIWFLSNRRYTANHPQ